MKMKKEIYDELYCFRTKLNNYLESVNFDDKALLDLSYRINDIIEEYELSCMSETDKKAMELRKLLSSIDKGLKKLNHKN